MILFNEGFAAGVADMIIDDLRSLREEGPGVTVYARSSAAGLKVLQTYLPFGVDRLWLDHDLGLLEDGTPDTIMGVVDWLSLLAFEGKPYPVNQVLIHTSNPVGRKNIKTALDRWGYPTAVIFDPSEMFVVKQ